MTTRTGATAETASEPAAAADGWIILLTGALMAFGVVVVYSASVSVDLETVTVQNWWRTPLKQGAFALLGFLAMLIAAGCDHRIWSWHRRWGGMPAAALAALASLALLVMLIPGIGNSALGARRAIMLSLGSFKLGFQPAEAAKVVLVIWLAALLARPNFDVTQFRSGFLKVVLTAGVLIGLTGIEDFGTAALMGLVTIGLLIAGRARLRHLLLIALTGLAAGAALIWLKPYRWERIVALFAGDADPAREGYQITQSLIAIGAGGWWGRGLGAGVQKYDYLPHDENDFIFSIICEELGVAGGLAVIAIFLLLLWRGYAVARRSSDPFGRLLATGLTLMICLQAAFNIAVVTHMVPTKGISLPFVSAGGSGLFFLGIAAGLIAAVGRRESATHESHSCPSRDRKGAVA